MPIIKSQCPTFTCPVMSLFKIDRALLTLHTYSLHLRFFLKILTARKGDTVSDYVAIKNQCHCLEVPNILPFEFDRACTFALHLGFALALHYTQRLHPSFNMFLGYLDVRDLCRTFRILKIPLAEIDRGYPFCTALCLCYQSMEPTQLGDH